MQTNKFEVNWKADGQPKLVDYGMSKSLAFAMAKRMARLKRIATITKYVAVKPTERRAKDVQKDRRWWRPEKRWTLHPDGGAELTTLN